MRTEGNAEAVSLCVGNSPRQGSTRENGRFSKNMSNEVHGKETSSHQERMSRLTPAQREMLEKRLRGEGPRSQSKSVIKRRPTLDYPITAEQEHLWLLHQMDPTTHYFNHSHGHRLQGELNIAALERTINEMVRRH